MSKPNEPKDRRTDFHRRVQYAIRKAHDPLFKNLVTPKNKPADKSQPAQTQPPIRIIRHG